MDKNVHFALSKKKLQNISEMSKIVNYLLFVFDIFELFFESKEHDEKVRP
jgi:hypothetical protein